MAGLSRCLARCRSRAGMALLPPLSAAPAPAGSVNAGQGTAGMRGQQTGSSDIPSPAPGDAVRVAGELSFAPKC